MLETEIKKLTEAVIDLTEIFKSNQISTKNIPQDTQNIPQKEIKKADSDVQAAVTDIFGETTNPLSEPAPTKDDVRLTLTKYLEKNGDQKTLALINKYGANKMSELKETDYAKIIAEASA